MTIKSIKTGWTGISAAAGYPQLGDFESIATVTIGSGGAANAEFTSIPSTYQHLQVRCLLLTASANQNVGIRFNSDTGSNYSVHELYGSGSAAGAIGTANTVFAPGGFTPGATYPGGFVLDILDYTNTNKYKTTRTLWGNDTNGGGYVGLSSGAWRNTNAITSITFYHTNSNNFNQHSHFALYGIKG